MPLSGTGYSFTGATDESPDGGWDNLMARIWSKRQKYIHL